jgi:tRNA/tmRNA/rRNA uracil-C5-methylase (TrmA/RlmC/RlmD family)
LTTIDSAALIPYFVAMEKGSTNSTVSLFNKYFSEAAASLPQRSLKHGECQTTSGQKCTLCLAYRINYDDEYQIKNRALQEYWKVHRFPQPLQSLVPSPFGRNYRVVTKRKLFSSNGKLQLGLIGTDDQASGIHPLAVGQCMIEPSAHSDIYRCVQDYLNRKEFREVAEAMNYVVVKGNYEEFTVIFNIASMDSNSRQFINHLSKHLTKTVNGVISVFTYIDEKRSRFYLPQRQKNQKLQFQKIFGKDAIFHRAGSKKFLYSPLSFSQTNLSVIEKFASTAEEILELNGSDQLFDLYCGYGLFSLSVADKIRNVTGIELSGDSIRDAKKNAERMHNANCRFIEGDIDEECLERIFSSHSKITKVILDPPRNGTKPGVIEIIAAKKIEKALHIFCNIELMPAELERWNSVGYKIARAIPFDMFPGTGEVEMMVLLEPTSVSTLES